MLKILMHLETNVPEFNNQEIKKFLRYRLWKCFHPDVTDMVVERGEVDETLAQDVESVFHSLVGMYKESNANL